MAVVDVPHTYRTAPFTVSSTSLESVDSKKKTKTQNENTEYTIRLGFKITEKENTLPVIYWIPKIHKNPPGAHFIIAPKIRSTKQISKCDSNVFQLVYFQIENFQKNAKFLLNYSKFWVLQNFDPGIQSLNNINKKTVPNLLQHMTIRHYTQSYLMIN